MYFDRVGVFGLNERGREDAKYDLALGRRRLGRVLALTVDVAEVFRQLGANARKRLATARRKVAVGLPRTAKVGRLFDDHRRGSKRLKGHYDVRERELGLEVELYEHVLLAVLRLPPAIETITLLATNNILNSVTVGVSHWVVGLARVAHETLGGVARRAQHTIAFGLCETTRRRGVQKFRPAYEQVTGFGIAVASQAILCPTSQARAGVCIIQINVYLRLL